MAEKEIPLLAHHYRALAGFINENPDVSTCELAASYLRTLGEDLSLVHQYRLTPFSQPEKEIFMTGIKKAFQAIQIGRVLIIPDSPINTDVICQHCPVDDPGYCNKNIVIERQKAR